MEAKTANEPEHVEINISNDYIASESYEEIYYEDNDNYTCFTSLVYYEDPQLS